jgi:cytochrome d ubiquinol oxidase subunit II
MTTAWFVFLAAMISIYVVLDGFDLGSGALHLRLARDETEREEVTGAIGPIWNGNEVWLIASGGVLFLAFPAAYAAAFSGLYFGLILVLWLLAGRGLALELRRQLAHPLWHTACDTVWCVSSAALAFVFGVALGNVVRGVPLGPDGSFHLELFEILSWYAVLVGVFGLAALAHHGAAFLSFRTHGALAARAHRAQRWLLLAVAVLLIALIAPTYAAREDLFTNLVDHPWRLVFPVAAVVALLTTAIATLRERRAVAFLGSALFLAALLSSVAAGLYPYILPGREGSPYGLTIESAASGDDALRTAVFWWPVGVVLAVVYFLVAYRMTFRRPPEALYRED